MMATERICRTCRFWRDSTHRRSDSIAMCYFNPPVVRPNQGGNVRPFTAATDLCGQWEHDGEKEPQ